MSHAHCMLHRAICLQSLEALASSLSCKFGCWVAGLLQQDPSQQPHLHSQRCDGLYPGLSAFAQLAVAVVCGGALLAAEARLEAPPSAQCYHLLGGDHCTDGECCLPEKVVAILPAEMPLSACAHLDWKNAS